MRGADTANLVKLVRLGHGARAGVILVIAPEFHRGDGYQKEEEHHATQDEVVVRVHKDAYH